MVRLIGLAFLMTIAASAAQAQSAAPPKMAATISKFECGDNCWLTVKWKQGEKQLLCMKACAAWAEKTQMPKSFVGRKVTVTLGVAPAFDGSNEIRDYVLAATELKF